VARKNPAYWIFTFSNTCQKDLMDFSCSVLLVSEIFEGFTKEEGLLLGLACGNEFGFGSRHRDAVLTASLPGDRFTVHHNDVDSV